MKTPATEWAAAATALRLRAAEAPSTRALRVRKWMGFDGRDVRLWTCSSILRRR
ncbi:hypothetical protein TIFTF001_015565 [Ficus carica]|uniref:Uncharacterized protein n=1 Tax=Ficus carica TaxID=3494 RepID=A0AA87ZYY5_FICCA|nr:hypothetical protein TIFTF001_015565 [Ficus carica]